MQTCVASGGYLTISDWWVRTLTVERNSDFQGIGLVASGFGLGENKDHVSAVTLMLHLQEGLAFV